MFAGAHVVLASEALLMAKKAGIDMASYFDAVRNSAGNSCESPSLLPTSKPARGMLCDMHTRRNTTHTLKHHSHSLALARYGVPRRRLGD